MRSTACVRNTIRTPTSHVDTENDVYRFLDGTDGEFVNLRLDTGDNIYCGWRQHRDRRGGARADRVFASQMATHVRGPPMVEL